MGAAHIFEGFTMAPLSCAPTAPTEVLPVLADGKTHVVKTHFCTLVWCPRGYAGLLMLAAIQEDISAPELSQEPTGVKAEVPSVSTSPP